MGKCIMSATAVIAFLFLFFACSKSTEPDSFNAKDGTASFIATEINDMGVSVMGSTSLPAKAQTEAVTVTWVREWSYNPEKKVFVREVNVTYPSGTRNRVDSVWFMGNSVTDTLGSVGLSVIRPSLESVGFIKHKRTSGYIWNDITADLDLDMFIEIDKTAPDTTVTKSGKIERSRNARVLDQTWSADINGVKRIYSGGSWSLPVEGTVNIVRTATNERIGRTVNRTLSITFQSDSTATVAAVRNRDGATVNFTIDFKASPGGVEQ